MEGKGGSFSPPAGASRGKLGVAEKTLGEKFVARLVTEAEGKQAVLGGARGGGGAAGWVLLESQVQRWFQIQVSLVRFTKGHRRFHGRTLWGVRTFLSREARQSREFGGLCRCRKQEPALAQGSSAKGSSAEAGSDLRAPGPGRPPSPTQRGAPGIFGARHAVSRRARVPQARTAPRAPTASGGDIWSAPRDGRGPQRPGQPSARSPACASSPGKDEVAQPNFSLPPGKAAWFAGWSARPKPPVPRWAWHLLFLGAHTEFNYATPAQPCPLLL